jgi:hypothetical protein
LPLELKPNVNKFWLQTKRRNGKKMLDSLLTQNNAREYALSVEANMKSMINAAEEGAYDDFQRILDNAEAVRQEYHRESIRKEMDEAADRVKSQELEVLNDVTAQTEENPYRFKAKRTRGRSLTYGTLEAEMTLPGGFKTQLKNSLLLTGVKESAENGMKLNQSSSPVKILKDALISMNLAPDLTTVDGSALESLAGILSQSGVSVEETQELLKDLVGDDGNIQMLDLLKTLTKAEDYLVTNASISQTSSTLTATPDGLNSLGQFLMGLGLSSETVKAVTSEMEIGAIIQVKTLEEIISSSGADSLQSIISEGDLNFLALALDSMGANVNDLGNLSLILEENKGAVTLGTLLDFLRTLEKPQTQMSLTAVSENIQDLLLKVENTQELVKAPVFNEILMKLSLMGDRELDKNFFELSPALQALRGGVSGMRADAQAGGDFNKQSGHNSEDRKEREERRLMNAAISEGSTSKVLSGAFSSSLYDEVSSYSSSDTIARQIRDKLIYSARRGIRRLKMNLSPEELGSLSIELKVVGNQMTANIQADSLEAYQALEKEVMALKDSLSAEGIELKLTLGYSGDSDSSKFFAKDKTEYQFGLQVNKDDYLEEENSQEEEDSSAYQTSGGRLNTVA